MQDPKRGRPWTVRVGALRSCHRTRRGAEVTAAKLRAMASRQSARRRVRVVRERRPQRPAR